MTLIGVVLGAFSERSLAQILLPEWSGRLVALAIVPGGPGNERVSIGDAEVILTAKEFRLLELFVKKPGRALTRDEILNLVWGYDSFVGSRSIDRFVTTLRNKIEPDPHNPTFIHTVREIGYKFEPPQGD